jgi:DNA-binding PadR family transcriptional regulator
LTHHDCSKDKEVDMSHAHAIHGPSYGAARGGRRQGPKGRHRGGQKSLAALALAMAAHQGWGHGERGWHGHRGPGGRGWGGGGRGRRARRGDVRAAILALLAEEPRNGYQMMQEIEQRSGGVWRPSPGSIYPALQQLEDEGLIRSEEFEGAKRFVLTDAGREQVATLQADDRPAPWDAVRGDLPEEALELRGLMMQLGAAVMQVAQVGDSNQLAAAKDLLAETRRGLYRILAEPDVPAGDDAPREA